MAKNYYFSGTGNSYQAAKKLSGKIDKCELIKITPALGQRMLLSNKR